jgi:hypothetical protein
MRHPETLVSWTVRENGPDGVRVVDAIVRAYPVGGVPYEYRYVAEEMSARARNIESGGDGTLTDDDVMWLVQQGPQPEGA